MRKVVLTMKIERVYHPYWDWEEVEFNMWGTVDDRKKWLKKAIEFTGDHKKYGRFMMRVINEWPISCENALTDSMINRKAWIGHAAVALAIQCPEDIVREAWGLLTDEQRLLANKEAERAVQTWENNYLQSKGLCDNVGGSLL
jgi:hypothetical protein